MRGASSLELGSVARRGALRLPGLLVLLGIVGAGIASGVAYLQYKAPRLRAELDARIAASPTTPEGRLEAWHVFGAPQIHHRLSTFGRFSTEHPWLVTHAVDRKDGAEPEFFGIDCTALPLELSHLEGMRVVVELPEPRSLGRARLEGETARFVPVVAAPEAAPDPRERLKSLALYLLDRIPEALAKDVPGASLEIRVVPGPKP